MKIMVAVKNPPCLPGICRGAREIPGVSRKTGAVRRKRETQTYNSIVNTAFQAVFFEFLPRMFADAAAVREAGDPP